MKRTEAIEWLKNIKEKYIHGGDDFYDCQRRTAIDYAMSVLENIEKKPTTNADRIRAMSDEELAVWMTSIRLDTINEMCKKFDVEIEMPTPTVENTADVCEWLKQPAR